MNMSFESEIDIDELTNFERRDRHDFWLEKARNEFPRVGSLYMVKKNKIVLLKASQKEIAALAGAIMMLTWVECPYEWAVRQTVEEKLYCYEMSQRRVSAPRFIGFNYKMLWKQNIWSAELCVAGAWDKIYEPIETKSE